MSLEINMAQPLNEQEMISPVATMATGGTEKKTNFTNNLISGIKNSVENADKINKKLFGEDYLSKGKTINTANLGDIWKLWKTSKQNSPIPSERVKGGLIDKVENKINKVFPNLIPKREDELKDIITNDTQEKINEIKNIDNEIINEKSEEETKNALEEAYRREDEIRKETQEREDTAYQRAVEDMKKAGINPNIFAGASAAASGGGITNASRKDFTKEMSKYEATIELLLTIINNEFKGSENEKDRIAKTIQTGLGLIEQRYEFDNNPFR